jgi:hypothetical protein
VGTVPPDLHAGGFERSFQAVDSFGVLVDVGDERVRLIGGGHARSLWERGDKPDGSEPVVVSLAQCAT